MAKRLTPAQHIKAVKSALIDAILAIPADVAAADAMAVVNAFKTVKEATKATPMDLCEAFWDLDTQPGSFHSYLLWHPRLRACRNTPTSGRALFALFA